MADGEGRSGHTSPLPGEMSLYGRRSRAKQTQRIPRVSLFLGMRRGQPVGALATSSDG
ncbi:MAG: hypothetical protein QOJ51_2410, partial [Acidobacteriaceae bacterium]|nr:hypothetical protein [Acidobacteriaceae bacterium]